MRAVESGVTGGLVAEGPGFSVVLDPSFSPNLALQKVQSSLVLQRVYELGPLCTSLRLSEGGVYLPQASEQAL